MPVEPNTNSILKLLTALSPKKCDTLSKVRVGLSADGGYVLPDDFDGVQGMLSIGVGPDVSFDHALAQKGIPSYQYDHTVEKNPIDHELFHFHKQGWAAETSGDFVSLGDMLERNHLSDKNDLILKFDVEGAEWDAFASISMDTLSKFRLIVCELHDFTRLYDAHFFAKAHDVITKLTRHHTCVHTHANNYGGISLLHGMAMPRVMEFSFIRNDRDTFSPSCDPIPGPLDIPNNPNEPDYVLRLF